MPETIRRHSQHGPIQLEKRENQSSSASGTDITSQAFQDAERLLLVINVTAKSGTAPTLDAAVQAKVGSNYVNLARFSQFADATGTKAIIVSRDAFATELAPAPDPAVGSGFLANNHDWLDTLRVKCAVAGTTPAFTFTVDAYALL